MNLCVIPARGGSKRIPRKNIRVFNGKPMIGWSIEAAKASGLFDHILVSTDDEEIAECAKAFGAEVPFMRPVELSGNHVHTRPVVNHAIREAHTLWGPTEITCEICATAPFLQASDLVAGRALLGQDDYWRFVMAVGTFHAPVHRAFVQTSRGGLRMLFPEHEDSRSQDLPVVLHDAGQFYWGFTDAFLSGEPMFSERTLPLRLPKSRVQDIDTPEDWESASGLHHLLRSSPTSYEGSDHE